MLRGALSHWPCTTRLISWVTMPAGLSTMHRYRASSCKSTSGMIKDPVSCIRNLCLPSKKSISSRSLRHSTLGLGSPVVSHGMITSWPFWATISATNSLTILGGTEVERKFDWWKCNPWQVCISLMTYNITIMAGIWYCLCIFSFIMIHLQTFTWDMEILRIPSSKIFITGYQ